MGAQLRWVGEARVTSGATAHDAYRQRVVGFSARPDGITGSTWKWDGGRWSLRLT